MAKSRKIRVDGEILIGDELDLLEVHGKSADQHKKIYPTEGGFLPESEYRLKDPIPKEDIKQNAINYRFEKKGNPLIVGDQGLVLQYGILGGPGSGKTNLLMHLLRQIVSHKRSDRDRKFGGLILDPKAALIAQVESIFHELGREEDLIVINNRTLHANGGVNIIDCMLSPMDLGGALVAAAQSSGIGSSEPYWFQQMAQVFGSILTLLRLTVPHSPPTLAKVIDVATGIIRGQSKPESKLDRLLKDSTEEYIKLGEMANVLRKINKKADGQRDDTLEALAEALEKLDESALSPARVSRIIENELNNIGTALNGLEQFISSDPENRITVLQFMKQAFGVFLLQENACYSTNNCAGNEAFYDQIINEGKFVLVSTGPHEIVISSILPTLIKWIFQRTVLSRFERFERFELHNEVRPILFMADEYHTVATQLEGSPFGDSEFFSQAREFGALSFIATQSVEQLRNSRLGDAWKAVFATLAALFFMRVRDPETGKYAGEYAGKKEYIQTKRGRSTSDGKDSTTVNTEIIEKGVIQPGLLEHKLTVGQAVVVGTTEGQSRPSAVRFVQVPEFK